jgi:hypothetical protein
VHFGGGSVVSTNPDGQAAKSAVRNLTILDHAKGEFNDALQALALGGIYRRLVFDVRPIGHA